MEYKEIRHIYTTEFITPVIGMSYIPKKIKACLFFQHGFNTHIRNYRHLAQFLAEKGIAVHMIDMPGHGLSTGNRGDISSFSDYTDTLALFVKLLDIDLPIFIGGHSLGGLISVDYALQYQNKVKGLLLAAPLLGFAPLLQSGSLLGYPLYLYNRNLLMPYPAITSFLRSSNQKYAQLLSDPLRNQIITPSLIIEVRKKIKEVQAKSSKLNVPCISFLAANDQVVQNTKCSEFLQNMPTTDVKIQVYANTKHEILHEEPADIIFSSMLKWMNKKLEK